jgi:hypothetical protein
MNQPKQNPHINARPFDGTLLLIDVDNAVLHELNEVGTRVWEMCDGTKSAEAIAVALTEEFDVTAEQATKDVENFLSLLYQRGALVKTD